MITYEAEIFNLKADKLLKDLADMNLKAIKLTNNDGFMHIVKRLTTKDTLLGTPSMGEITEEVETVRVKRYAKNKA